MASPEEPGGIFMLCGGASILSSLQSERKKRREMRRKLPGRIHHCNNKHFQKLGNPLSINHPSCPWGAWDSGRILEQHEEALSTPRNGVPHPEGQDFTRNNLQDLGGRSVSSVLV